MASSYYESLEALNLHFREEGGPAAKIVLVPDALEDEDMLEMLDAGILTAIVVDDWKTRMWAQILPKIRVNEAAVVREGGKLGWAIRKGTPKLEAEILDFYKGYLQRPPTGTAEWKRFEQTYVLFEKYGQKFNFDPLMLTAADGGDAGGGAKGPGDGDTGHRQIGQAVAETDQKKRLRRDGTHPESIGRIETDAFVALKKGPSTTDT